MPHSVVHIVDNSMYAGQLPTVVADDPSLYATLVVTGAPMGADNEIISINRSDVLNVAYGINNLSSADIKKFGQTVTYPGSILSQNAPIKFMRVTPPDSTYAFSCLLVQWKWDGTTMHVRFKTTSDEPNDGLPAGVIHSSFKNTERLNNVLVRGFSEDASEQNDGWTTRVFMTAIAAGRGKIYDNFNYSINLTQQTRRPANVRYLFSTIDTRISSVVEQFAASLVNENNSNRLDAIDTVNVSVGKRVKGSSILVPTINENAVKELYTEYMARMKDMIDADILPVYGTTSMEFVNDVYKTMTVNIFDAIYGRYIYNGDTDVRLPYYQVDMIDLDIPRLSEGNRIKTYLDGTPTPDQYKLNPTDLQSILDSNTYGIENAQDKYHVGDVFCNAPASLALQMIIGVNQYTGSVTSIPITQVYTKPSNDRQDPPSDEDKDMIKGYIYADITDTNALKAAAKSAVDSRKIIPRVKETTGEGVNSYYSDFVIIGVKGVLNYNDLNSFVLGEIAYTDQSVAVAEPPEVTSVTVIEGGDIYDRLVINTRSSITSFAVVGTDSEYINLPGTVVLDLTDTSDVTKCVYVNSYNIASYDPEGAESKDDYIKYVNSGSRFSIGLPPSKVYVPTDIVGTSYDDMIYMTDGASSITVAWKVTNGKPTIADENTPATNYVVGDLIKVADIADTYFKVTAVVDKDPLDPTKGQNVTIVPAGSAPSDTKLEPGTYETTTPYTRVASQPGEWPGATGTYKKFVNGLLVDISATETWNDNTDYYKSNAADPAGAGLLVQISAADIAVSITPKDAAPLYIYRYTIGGTQGSLYRYGLANINIPANYYSPNYGLNPNSELGGIPVENGYAGFLDDNISDIEFKWYYSELLVRAYRGDIDARISSPTRCPAKYLFDGGTNTIVGQTILPYIKYSPIDIINASTVYTDDEKEAILLNNDLVKNIKENTDVDVKQAMYDLMILRVYQGIPEDKRPIGPGSGLSLHLDAGVTDANTAMLVNQSFSKRFNNPNASWDIGGYVSSADGIAYTYIKRIVDNLFVHSRQYTVNKPFTGKYTNIGPTEYTSFFPDIDTTDWELRELLYNSGGNAWIMDINGNLQRQSQRTLSRTDGTSDLIQESNMRTLSQLVYLLQNKINSYLLEYNDDGVLATLKDEVDNMFSNWVGKCVQDLEILFKRDINPEDGGEIVVCYVNVTFRGLILRVPIIVNVQRRTTAE